ncbi:hypothetical protein [Gracilinema caldarium]|uniref:Guanylate cyclase domain-containing protein n=1 Tax=Gracilinema caldarium (strain ATCC 51460 / DSM 7334 / H1) TaxID=744872 RepID=F8F4C0_GRAC1|nr:hypothetical protein [Gracilinema caldarium]AEJ20567.1 hypothetical protein Spica_2462 [Gracilinema caldarium DSM 7334]
MIVNIYPSRWIVKDPNKKDEFNQDHQIMLVLEEDQTLVIADIHSDIPKTLYRQKLMALPPDEELQRIIGEVFGIEKPEVRPYNPNVELDTSALQGLKKMPVDIFHNDYLDEKKPAALVLCTDIRNFSGFLRDHDEGTVFKLIKEFTSNFLSCVNQFGYGCSYYKLLGDGALIIWDETNEATIQEALAVFDTYIEFLETDLFCEYPQLGLGGALVSETLYKYEISAEASQLKYRDYIGYGINLAARIQGLAQKNQLVINKALAKSGKIPYQTSEDPIIIEELKRLKGLKEEDLERLYYYEGKL